MDPDDTSKAMLAEANRYDGKGVRRRWRAETATSVGRWASKAEAIQTAASWRAAGLGAKVVSNLGEMA